MSLITRLKQREPAAFDEAYERYANEVYVFLTRLCRDRNLANDLFQDTWIQLVRFAPLLRDDSNLGAWLCVVARNVFFKHRRFIVLDEERLLQLRFVLAGDSSDEPSASFLEEEILDKALHRLPIADREIILLSLKFETGQDEMAQALGLTPSTFRQRLSRARRRLAKEVACES